MTASSVPDPPEPDAHPAARADLREMVQRLADARRERAAAAAVMAKHRTESTLLFEKDFAEPLAREEAAYRAVNSAEQALRGFALAYYGLTRDKAPAPGVEIAIGVDYVIDLPAALAWAEKTGTALIPASVDLKAMKKIAKATPLPFATRIETPAVRVASDLDAALKEAV